MKRVAFETGQAHQAAVAAWARRRLADGKGAQFDDGEGEERPWQWGCLLADGVGLGKTWEALAAAALILAKGAKWRRDGAQRERGRRRRASVLILTPPGLVSKWTRELRDPSGFSARLESWVRRATGREFVQRTLHECFELRRRSDVDALPSGTISRGRYALPGGTYVCNWNVFLGEVRPGRDRINALRKQVWDVLIVDEAHHARAREALQILKNYASTLLLSATPFQLDPTELHLLTEHMLQQAKSHRILYRGEVREYVKATERWFEGGEPPTRRQRRDAERVLGQLVARSQVSDGRRRHFVIDGAGVEHEIAPPTQLGAGDLPAVFKQTIEAPAAFRNWYLQRRLELATKETQDPAPHVAVELRKRLSTTGTAGGSQSPRLDALGRWARRQLAEDLCRTAEDGVPRKLLVFTHFVARAANELRDTLQHALSRAYLSVRDQKAWRLMRGRAEGAFDRVERRVVTNSESDQDVVRILRRLRSRLEGTLFFDLFGHRRFARLVEAELTGRLQAAQRVVSGEADSGDDGLETARWLKRQQRGARRSALRVLGAISRGVPVATYTGDDERTEREAFGEAFRSPLAPWVLVASNVGSEGIDLHTYGRHLVHFDLEWNPAVMEQREGRIDRLGRVLKNDPVSIYYLIVKDTYDERMFHQLVARQRWHGVLLGRGALRLGRDEETEARLVDASEAAKVALDLRPRR